MTPKPHIALVVEDDHSWQNVLSEILSDYGLQVDVTDNLQTAVGQIRSVPYRLAIVDLSLAGQDHHNQDGLKVLEAVNRYLPGCASVLLTGYASVELAVAAIQEHGAHTCLRKENFRRAEFREVIHQALSAPAVTENEPLAGDESDRADPGGKAPADELIPGLALVIEDDAGWRSLLTELLGDCGYQVHVSASYGEAQGQLKREHYQLVIADISLASSLEPDHNQDGYRLLNSIHQANIPTVVVSGYADPDLIDQAYTKYDIFACFEKQAFERSAFTETVQEIARQTSLTQDLTDREIEVLALVAQGYGNKQIAAELFISTNTVKRHLKSIFSKLDVNSRAAASAYATRVGLDARLQGE
jgi:DNA-binding NarL/FixJ family response regulator